MIAKLTDHLLGLSATSAQNVFKILHFSRCTLTNPQLLIVQKSGTNATESKIYRKYVPNIRCLRELAQEELAQFHYFK